MEGHYNRFPLTLREARSLARSIYREPELRETPINLALIKVVARKLRQATGATNTYYRTEP